MVSPSLNSSPRGPRSRAWILYPAVVLITLGVLVAVVGETYEAAARARDERHFRRWGDLVDIGGYRLNLNCLGQGSPTVVLDSGLGLPAAEWSLVQPDVGEFTRVCSYDRAGYGWSDSGPIPRTSTRIAEELHRLLQNSGVRGPYVLVGHSFGGFNMRVFAHEYSSEVAAMVLVDAAHEDQWSRLPAPLLDAEQRESRVLHHWQPFIPVLVHLGVQRFMSRRQPLPGVPADVVDEVRYLQLSSKFFDSMLGEMDALPQSIAAVRASGNLGDRPLLVLTAGDAGADLPPQFDREAYRKIWITQLQPSLVRLSRRGRQVIVPDAGHLIPMQQPQAVVAGIREVVDMVRAK